MQIISMIGHKLSSAYILVLIFCFKRRQKGPWEVYNYCIFYQSHCFILLQSFRRVLVDNINLFQVSKNGNLWPFGSNPNKKEKFGQLFFFLKRSLTTVLFIRVVQAVVPAITAQLSGDADAVPTCPVGLQTALSGGAVLLVWAGGTLDLSVAAGWCVKTADRVHARKLTWWAFRKALEGWQGKKQKHVIFGYKSSA